MYGYEIAISYSAKNPTLKNLTESLIHMNNALKRWSVIIIAEEIDGKTLIDNMHILGKAPYNISTGKT